VNGELRLYNTASLQKETVGERELGLYVCGVTPYDTTHLGHAFTYTAFDVLVRYLRFCGRRVTYVRNITDIDDDVLLRAHSTGVDWKELGDREYAKFAEDMRRLNNLPPEVEPRATGHIPEILRITEELVRSGLAYEKDGCVYFEVKKYPQFGRLCRLSYVAQLDLANERGNFPADPLKRDPLDFVLWQASAAAEPRWESPWGVGRPGWHIECSAMALEHLGPQVDGHGGGSDLIYPHHESEIAQSESATGMRPFARIWVHVGMLRYQGEKMSKSLRNLVLVRDLLPRYDADSIRVLLLRHHYRDPWEYTPDQLDDAAAWTARLRAAASRTRNGMGDSALAVRAALEDDLDTSGALHVLEEAIDSGDRDWRAAAELLGLELSDPRLDHEEMKKALGWRAPFHNGGGS